MFIRSCRELEQELGPVVFDAASACIRTAHSDPNYHGGQKAAQEGERKRNIRDRRTTKESERTGNRSGRAKEESLRSNCTFRSKFSRRLG